MRKFMIINRLYSTYNISLLTLVVLSFFSCEKNIETYHLTDKEKNLVMLYEEGDTFKFKDKDNQHFIFKINNIDTGISEYDFLGVPQWKTEWIDVDFECITECGDGTIGCSKSEEIWYYNIQISIAGNAFDFQYKDYKRNSYRLETKNELVIDSTNYKDVYIFNNATSETAKPAQKIYLNTDYGFLKLEDLEKEITYTIVRD